MQTSPNGIAFLEENEGFVDHVYPDNGKSAIGFGHDILPGDLFPPKITKEEGRATLLKDLSTRFEPAVRRLAPQANQNQFDALVDFCFNLGPGDLATMLHHGFAEAPFNIPAWCYKEVDGVEQKSSTLKARRQKEVVLFNTPVV